MLNNILIILAGLTAITWGASKFVDGAVALAQDFKISPIIIGLTIVALGTSAPEMFVSALAAIHGKPGIAIGNVMGSNIANVLLVFGAGLAMTPMQLSKKILQFDFPFVLAVTLLMGALAVNNELGRADGVILIVVLLGYFMKLLARRHTDVADENNSAAQVSVGAAIGWTLLGLAALLIGSHYLVAAAGAIAASLGVSDVLIGVTVVAIGTSLPEVAAVMTSAYKGHSEIAIGSVLGSNVFNILAVLPFPAFIHPHAIDGVSFWRDFAVMILVLVILAIFCYQPRREKILLARWQGVLLLAAYVLYLSAVVMLH